MLNTYHEVASCAPSRHNDVYIFSIAPLARDGLAAITSANELLLLQDRGALGTPNVSVLSDCPHGVTSMAVADAGQTVFCAGNDGHVAVYDYRTRSKAVEFRIGFKALNAIACRGTDVAVGGDAVVSVWDRRQNKVRWQNTELNDEITALDFHPTQDNVLLAGGDDGLVSIFDTQIAEEEDSLVQAVNHGPIHKAGFLGTNDLYALSSDQNLALHSLTLEDTDDTEPSPDLFGDLRPIVPCEYVIDVFQTGPDHVVACGSHSQTRVDLVKLVRGSKVDPSQRIVLEGAHVGEVVRSIFADETNGTIFTAGEDGRIAAFRPSEGQSVSSPTSTTTKLKKGLAGDARYKPY